MGHTIRTPVLLALLLVLAVALVTMSYGTDWFSTSPTESEFELVEEAWEVILDDYVEGSEIDLGNLSQGAIRGMIDALSDPYTAYFDADRYQQSQDKLGGSLETSFEGIGAVITIDREDQLVVVAPIVGTPAHEAGILPGDAILEIDGESTEGMELVEAVLKVRGEPGTEVNLSVLHPDASDPVPVTVTRQEITVESVLAKILDDGIAHIEVHYFSSRTGSELRSALDHLIAGGVRGIVLDLRDNPGGPVSSAVSVASEFLEEGVMAYIVDSEGNEEAWEVEEGGVATDLPLAVLVNGHSASASELVAGALQDHDRGPVIGTTTLGKGAVNHFHQLSDGSAIYITSGRWFTPDRQEIEGNGITPDETVEFLEEHAETGVDPQLQRAVEYLQGEI
jgi:carboxyl-terminal processing protease